MSGTVRVLLYHLTAEAERIEEAYHRVSEVLAGVDGLLGNELMRSVFNPHGFVVMSTWSHREAFDRWEQGTAHKDDTAPLRPYRDVGNPNALGVYEVVAAHGSAEAAEPVR